MYPAKDVFCYDLDYCSTPGDEARCIHTVAIVLPFLWFAHGSPRFTLRLASISTYLVLS